MEKPVVPVGNNSQSVAIGLKTVQNRQGVLEKTPTFRMGEKIIKFSKSVKILERFQIAKDVPHQRTTSRAQFSPSSAPRATPFRYACASFYERPLLDFVLPRRPHDGRPFGHRRRLRKGKV